MLAEFIVKNFLSIREEQRLSFIPGKDAVKDNAYCHDVGGGKRLLKIGIVYGANASGKSNLLEAVDFFRRLVLCVPKDKSAKLPFTPFLFDAVSSGKPSLMRMVFYLDGLRYVLSITFDSDRIYDETLKVFNSSHASTLYKRSFDPHTDSTLVNFGTSLRLSRAGQKVIVGNTINNCTLLAAFGKSNVETTKLNTVYDFFSNSFRGLFSPSNSLSGLIRTEMEKDEDGRLKRFVLRLLKASDFNISGLRYKSQSQGSPIESPVLDEFTFLHRTNEGTFELTEAHESAGTRRFMGMATLLYCLLTKKNFFAIDEVETSIHYELVSYFIRCFLANCDNQSQLLLTTHDINLLDEGYIPRDVVWFTDKDKLGSTHVERLSEMGLHKNLSPYNAYKQGKLIDLPFLDSPYLNMESV